MYWITVIMLHLVGFLSIGSWMRETQNAYIGLWWLPLSVGLMTMIYYRNQPKVFRWLMFVPITVMTITGVYGRWHWF